MTSQKIATLVRALRVWLATFFAIFSFSVHSTAHELLPAVADLELSTKTAELTIVLSLEPMIAKIDLSEHSDSTESPQAIEYDRLALLPPDALKSAFQNALPEIVSKLSLRSGSEALTPTVEIVDIPEANPDDGARISEIRVTTELPKGTAPITVAWAPEYGPLILRYRAPDGSEYNAFLQNGDRSAALTPPKGGFLSGLFGN